MAHCDCFINQAMNAIIPNEQFDPEYVYYVTKNNIHKLKMLDSGTASGRENVSKSAFANMEIQIVVDITSQKKIGAILAAYDALIENNQKQIKLLEEAAQRLYKEWFVVDNMPKEWRRTNINEILTFHRGYDLTKTAMKDGPYPVIGSTSILGYHNEYKTGGPGIVTGRSGSLGQYQLVWENYWPHNTSLYVSDFKGHNIFYIFNLLKTVDFSALNNGGAIPTLNRNVLSNIEIFEPVKDLQEKYAVVVEPFYQKIRILSIQNQKLLESRDRLLPKLMSGEIEV